MLVTDFLSHLPTCLTKSLAFGSGPASTETSSEISVEPNQTPQLSGNRNFAIGKALDRDLKNPFFPHPVEIHALEI